jgi:hypothetical protein
MGSIIVPTLRRGNAAGDAPASRQAGYRWVMMVHLIEIESAFYGRDVVVERSGAEVDRVCSNNATFRHCQRCNGLKTKEDTDENPYEI